MRWTERRSIRITAADLSRLISHRPSSTHWNGSPIALQKVPQGCEETDGRGLQELSLSAAQSSLAVGHLYQGASYTVKKLKMSHSRATARAWTMDGRREIKRFDDKPGIQNKHFKSVFCFFCLQFNTRHVKWPHIILLCKSKITVYIFHLNVDVFLTKSWFQDCQTWFSWTLVSTNILFIH